MRDLYVVIDMQNDIVLKNEAAKDIITPMVSFLEKIPVRSKDSLVVATRTTYPDAPEERHLIKGTEGWEIIHKVQSVIDIAPSRVYLNKETFGAGENVWKEVAKDFTPDRIFVMGICVNTSALELQTIFPSANIYILGDLCADTSLDVLTNHQFVFAKSTELE